MSPGGENNDLPDSEDDMTESVLLRPGMDRILDTLCKRRRRMILLLMKNGTIETQADVMIHSKDGVREDEITLVHTHLPKLADAGYIEWNRETGELSKGPQFGEVEPLLDLLETYADDLPPEWP